MSILSRLGAVALAAPVVLAPSAIGETLPGGSKSSEMIPSVIQLPGSSPSSRNPSLSRNNVANWSRPDAASVAQVSREVAQEDTNKQQPTNSQHQGDGQPSNPPIVLPDRSDPAKAIADLEMQIREDNQKFMNQTQQNGERFQEFLRKRQQQQKVN